MLKAVISLNVFAMPLAPKLSPDELLTHLEETEGIAARGRLRIFLGYASGVGKSLRMFDEGRRRRERGQDVIAGAIQARNSPQLASLLQQIEVIPEIHEGGAAAIDVGRIIQRKPQVCLIDGLAHDNPPGNTNASRWQDIEELLSAGISVITTVNIAYVAELQKQVAEIRGKTSETTVPLAFIRKADEVVVVDAPANYYEKLKRKPGSEEKPGDEEKRLSQLREIALLLAADVVDWQLEAYLDQHNVASNWGTQERILVCLSSRSPALRMMQRAQLARQRFHGTLFALHVNRHGRESGVDEPLARNLQIARDLHAKVIVLDEADEVKAIIDFARRERITQVFVGHHPVPSWQRWFRPSAASKIIKAGEGIDVKLFPY